MNLDQHETDQSVQPLLSRLDQAIDQLQTLPEAARWQSELIELRTRLAGQNRLIAVFGAFSAGKSSLLNAVLSEPLLAVSPNPTTAAVTQIRAGDETLMDATVTAKTEAQLWDDVREAALQVHLDPENLPDVIERANALRIPDLPAQARRPASFLKSVAAGYADMAGRLGSTWTVPIDELRTYTANEQVACFLQQVDVSQRAAFLERGFVLVDTPGVDSIHRRHTDVAFQYMRKADAIVFVLYYTHAFSRVDKDFLLQLAGVQDVSELDKLFVVINAVDLAKSDEEREAVRARVVDELRRAGIRQPRVFEVSSQIALAAEQLAAQPDQPQFSQLLRQRLRLAPDAPLPDLNGLLETSGIATFLSTLEQVTDENALALAESAVERMLSAIRRQVHAQAARIRSQAAEDEEQRQARKLAGTRAREGLAQRAREVADGSSEWERGLHAEWQTLVYHAGERIRLRFGELFREAFHPGRFREERKADRSLHDAAEELAATLERQVDAEARTFAMRVDRQCVEAMNRLTAQLVTQLDEVSGGAVAVSETGADFSELTEIRQRATIPAGQFAVGFHHFKSARQFFEGGGQTAMRDELEAIAVQKVRGQLEQATAAIEQQASLLLRAAATEKLQEADERLATYADGMQSVDAGQQAAWEHAEAWFGA